MTLLNHGRIARALGDCVLKVPVTAMKSFIGHFDAGAGAVELAGTLLSLKNGEVPATLNYEISRSAMSSECCAWWTAESEDPHCTDC